MASVPVSVGRQSDSLREAFGIAISDIARRDKKIVVLDADVAGGTGTHHFRTRHAERFIQCGIAEQNMVGVAAGLAHSGFKPFVTTFAVFMLRAFEQVRLSVACSRKNVKLVASHPGLDVGPDGASAQCLEDMAAMRSLPGMVVLSPCDAFEVLAATRVLAAFEGPAYMRTGRSPSPSVFTGEPEFQIGKGMVLRQGTDITLIACGVMTHRALKAAGLLSGEGVSARVVHMPSIKPIDRELIWESATQTKAIVSCEDHNIIGGLGSAVAEVLLEKNPVPMARVGVSDSFGESGEPDALAEKYEIDAQGICTAAKRLLLKATN